MTSNMRNITRTDYDLKRTHGWLVRVQHMGQTHIKFFSDGVHGGKRKALAVAKEYRESIQRLEGGEHWIWSRSIVRKNNTSGIPGVGRYTRMDTQQVYWCAHWTEQDGTRRQRKFAVTQYGERRARQLAIEERTMQLKRLCP